MKINPFTVIALVLMIGETLVATAEPKIKTSTIHTADKCTCPSDNGQSNKPVHQIHPDKKQGIMICNLESGMDEVSPKSDTYLPMDFGVYRCGEKKPLLIFDNVHEESCSLKKDKTSFTLMSAVSMIDERNMLQISYTIYYPNGAIPAVKAELINEDKITKEMLSRPLVGEIPNDSNKLGIYIKALQGNVKTNKSFLRLLQHNQYDGAAGQEFSAYESSYKRFIKYK